MGEVSDEELRELARMSRANGRLEERLEIIKSIDAILPTNHPAGPLYGAGYSAALIYVREMLRLKK